MDAGCRKATECAANRFAELLLIHIALFRVLHRRRYMDTRLFLGCVHGQRPPPGQTVFCWSLRKGTGTVGCQGEQSHQQNQGSLGWPRQMCTACSACAQHMPSTLTTTVLPPAMQLLMTDYVRGPVRGKLVVVTGGNAGVGKETARQLYAAGANVVIACRSIDKGQRAVEDIEQSSSTAGFGSVEVMQLDLADPTSIRAFAKRYTQRHSQLHILVNNAGLNTNAAYSGPRVSEGGCVAACGCLWGCCVALCGFVWLLWAVCPNVPTMALNSNLADLWLRSSKSSPQSIFFSTHPSEWPQQTTGCLCVRLAQSPATVGQDGSKMGSSSLFPRLVPRWLTRLRSANFCLANNPQKPCKRTI